MESGQFGEDVWRIKPTEGGTLEDRMEEAMKMIVEAATQARLPAEITEA